jgi:hypothetical protein
MNLLNCGVILQLLALTAWTGGLFALLFLPGGNVFAGVDEARSIRARMARRFNGVEVIAGLVLLTGGGMLYLADVETRFVACNVGASGLMYALFITYGFGISQRVDLLHARLRGDGDGGMDGANLARLGFLSRICTFLMSVNLLLGIAQIVLLVYMLTRATQPPSSEDPSMNLLNGGAFGSF